MSRDAFPTTNEFRGRIVRFPPLIVSLPQEACQHRCRPSREGFRVNPEKKKQGIIVSCFRAAVATQAAPRPFDRLRVSKDAASTPKRARARMAARRDGFAPPSQSGLRALNEVSRSGRQGGAQPSRQAVSHGRHRGVWASAKPDKQKTTRTRGDRLAVVEYDLVSLCAFRPDFRARRIDVLDATPSGILDRNRTSGSDRCRRPILAVRCDIDAIGHNSGSDLRRRSRG